MSEREIYNEKELLLRIAEGEVDAFKELYRRHLNDAYSLAISFLHVPQAAEDLVQELFIKLWIKRATLANVEQFSPYMLVSLRNMLINELEKRKNRHKYEQFGHSMTTTQATPAEQTEAVDLQKLIKEAISRLPPQQQHIYHLNKEQGLDVTTISKELQLAPKTVSNILSLVLGHIRSFLHEYGYLITMLIKAV